MRNFTLNRFKFFKPNFLILFILLITSSASAQFYTKHYIAPAPWQYFSKANEIVIATNSTTAVNIEILKSDGTLITNTLTAVKGTPAVYRFAGLPKDAPALKLSTVLNAAGLIVTGSKPVSINLRNVASDALGGDGSDKDIKGNAALTSFGDAGIGIRYRIGYYRDGSLGNFGGYGDQRPIYSIMGITNGTSVKLNNVVIATLNAGQSYLFTAPLGSLVESSNPTVMNTSAAIDTPDGCGDGAYNQIPPEAVLGSEYFIERGKGNDTAEQTTVVATKPNTKVTVDTFSATGALTGTVSKTLVNAGDFYTFMNGISKTNFSASRVSATNNVAVYSGTAKDCEVDVYTVAPVSECGGSNFIETAKFRNYGVGSLPYFGYVLLKDAAAKVYVNGVDIETKSGIAARHQLGTTGWYLINFEDTQIGSPDVLSLSSDAKLTVSIVQQGGGFSMAGFFSNFAIQPEDPTFTYVSGGGCTNNTAALKTPSGFSPYQWYLNGVAISGANSDTYTATKTGSYSVASTLTCGAQTQSKPVSVTLCTDLEVTKTVNNATPCVGSNVEFTVKLNNLGVNNSTGVSVNDLLPTGYSFVSSTVSTGSYNSGTGVWSIGDVNGGVTETLKIVAKVNPSGVYLNKASLPDTTTDSNLANNSASISTTPNALPTLTISNPASVCAPSKVDLTAAAITAGSSANLTYTYWTNSTATTAYTTPTAATAGTYYIKGTNAAGCSEIKSVVVTVAAAPNAGTISGTQNICIGGTSTFSSNGNSGGSWTSSDANIATVDASTGVVRGVAEGSATITYKVTGTGGCSDVTSNRSIKVNPFPTASITGSLTACLTTTLNAQTNAASPAYVWYKNNAVISGETSSSLVVNTDGDYKVKVTNGATTCEQISAVSTVKVSDTEKPVKPVLADVTAQCSVTVTNPTTTDNCKGTVTGTTTDPLTYNTQGSFNITWSFNDENGNIETALQKVIITDTQKPTVTCPSDVVAFADANSCAAAGVNLGVPSTTDNCSGTVTVTNNAPSSYPLGNTIVTWTATDAAGNIQTCSQNVKVVGPIKANDDKISSFNGNTGGTAVSNVLSNDLLNCNNIVRSDIDLILSSPLPSVLTFDTISGAVTVKQNTPAGTYSFNYQICEVSNSGNCSTATVEIIVTTPVIDAVTETTASVNGTIGGTTSVSLTANDTLNGNPVVIGTSAGQVTLTSVNVPSGLTLNADGTVKADAGTPAGTYEVEYRICEVNNPSNCDQVKSYVSVTGSVLDLKDDTVASAIGTNQPQTLLNVLANDTKDGNAVNLSEVNISVSTADPKGYLSLNADGTIELKANAPAGDYEFAYQVCEKLNPSNCAAAVVKVTVGAPVIDAVTETTASVNGTIGGTTSVSLTANDTLNGNPVVIGTSAGQVILTAVNVPSGLTLNADGTVKADAGTPAGTYEVEYRICEVNNPSNCDQVKSYVSVTGSVLDLKDDTVASAIGTNQPQTLLNVLANDTKDGNAINLSEVNISVSTADPKGYLSLNADGTIELKANAPAGDYEFAYQVCEKLNPSNCATAVVKVTVGAPVIDAVTETTASVNGTIGGTTSVSLTANDTLNGNPFVIGTSAGQVTLTAVNVLSGLTLNADGTVKVDANTPAGTYEVEYRICEVNNPSNCDQVKSYVSVTGSVLDLKDDTVASSIGTNQPQTLLNVLANDTKDGNAVNLSEVNISVSTADPKGYLSLNADGTIELKANAPAGDYEFAYQVCEKLNPSNCATAVVKVTVGAPIIDAVTETAASVNGTIGGTTSVSLTANDTLNGNPVVIGTSAGQVTLTSVNVPGGLTLNADGTVKADAGTPAGTYEVEYRICEVNNPSNCDQVKSYIVVTGGILQANADVVLSVVGTNQPKTVINVFDNDTNNGLPVVANELNLSIDTPDPTGFLTLNSDGTAILGANAPAGTYELIYKICEKLNPTNCSSASIKVTVTAPTMTVTATSYCSNNVPYVSYTVTPDNFTPNNLLTVKWIDSANNVVATQTNLPLNGTILWPGAIVDGNGTGVDWPGWLLTNGQWIEGADGFENTRTGVTMEFSLNPTVNVAVNYPTATPQCNSRPTFAIKANNDTAGPIDTNKGISTSLNIYDNDTLNGVSINPANAVLSTVVPNANLILNANGSVDVKSGTVSGIYQLTYQICDASNSSNCSQAVVKVTVVNTVSSQPTVIITKDDLGANVDGINGELEFINVLANDVLNGLPINPANVVIANTPQSPYFEFNSDGTVNVKPNTPGGNYALIYQVCEKANSSMCSTATLNVFVEVPNIAIIKTAVFNDENASGFANAGETITYKFKVTNTGNVPLKNIKISDPLPGVVVSGQPITLEPGESDENTFTAQYKITQDDINRGSVSNQATVSGSSEKGITVDDKSDDASNGGDNPTVLNLNGCQIKVMNSFSPNGDSKNARFYIQGLECYPDNTVEIYNRWGVLVFDIDHYNNEDRVFVGISAGRATVKQSDGLPVGTYFYILKYRDSDSNQHEMSGYVYINK